MTLNKDEVTGVLKISGPLDIDAADSLREPDVAADLSGVDMCDAAAVQVLLAAHGNLAYSGKAFRIVAASEAVTVTAAALGFSIGEFGFAQGEDHQDAS
jgi:anti-anti-sigma regulatory factor